MVAATHSMPPIIRLRCVLPLMSRDLIRPLGVSGRAWRQAKLNAPLAEHWPLAAPLLAMVAGWLIIVWPWLSGRVTSPWDAKAQFLPQIQFMAQSLAHGESPFWAPYAFSGQNQIADPQSMIFSPPFLLLALVDSTPSAWAVDVTTLLAQLAGAGALLVWFRDKGWHPAGALIAALTFVFGASMAWRVQHTGQVLSLSYWPMAMLALERTMARRSSPNGIVLGLLTAAILLGRDQVAMLVLYLLAAYGVWLLLNAPRPREQFFACLPVIGLAGATAVLIAGAPLLLTALLAEGSNRPVIDLEGAGRGSLHPALLITAIIPQLFGAAFRMEDYWGPPSFAWNDTGLYIAQNMGQIYIGILPVLLIASATLRGQLWAREIRFFVVALAITMLYALGWYTPVFQVIYALAPGVSLYRRPADATFLIGALGAVLAGYATHRLFKRPWEKMPAKAWMAVAGVLLAAALTAVILAVRSDRLALLPYPMVASTIAIAMSCGALIAAQSRMALEPWAAAIILAGVTTADIAWNNGPSSSSALPPALYEVLDPATKNPVIGTLKAYVEAGRSTTRRDRIELLGLGFHWPNASLTHGLENTLGYNPVRLKLYSDATGAGDNIGAPEERKFTPLLPSYRSMLVDMLGLRYVAAGAPLETIDPKLKPGDWQLIAQTGGAWIYENPRALPRISFAHRSIGTDFGALLATGSWPAFDPATTVLLEPGRSAYFSGSGAATVAMAHYGHTAVEVEADSATGGYVVLNDLWHPWWFAEIDGQPAKIERANVLFRAVEVASGKHHVTFTFRPLQGAWTQLFGPAK